MMDQVTLSRPQQREYDVVAVVLSWRGRVALFKRSQLVRHDRGLWHCITGYLDDRVLDPRAQAVLELHQETGLRVCDLNHLDAGPVLVLAEGGVTWRVHTFTAESSRRRLRLNWEHDCYRWVPISKVKRFSGRVAWLDAVLAASSAKHEFQKCEGSDDKGYHCY